MWLGYLAKQIDAFANKIASPTMTYETLYSYFVKTVQYGGDVAEFWVVRQGMDPLAFAHWFVPGLPHRGVVFCDFITSWNRKREPVKLLLDEFIAFGKKNRCPIYRGTAINEAIYRVFRKAADRRGYSLIRSEYVDFLGSKKNE